MQVQRLQAERAGQIDVGIEIGVGDVDAGGRRLGAQARRDDVRPPPDQIDRERSRQSEAAGLFDRGRDDGEPAVRPLAEQSGELIAGQRDQAIERVGFELGGVKLAARQAHRALVFEVGLRPALDQLGAFLADAHGVARGPLVGEELDQVGVGLGHRGGNLQTRFGLFRRGGLRLRGRRRQRRAILAEEVELVVEAGGDLARGMPAVRKIGLEGGRKALVEAFLRLRHAGGSGDRGPQIGAGDLGHRRRAAGSRRRGLEIGRVGQSLVDQLIELRVAIGLPPGVRGPVGLGRGEAFGVGVGRRRLNARRFAEVRRAADEDE